MKKVLFTLIVAISLFFTNTVFGLTLNKNTDYIYASGETIGIKLDTGILVVGTYGVKESNKTVKPWEKSRIQENDKILALNEEEVSNIGDIQRILNKTKNTEIALKYVRGTNVINSTIKPAKKEDNTYSLGLYIKDKVLGIGTLTYVLKEHNIYGALGHSINLDTNFNSGQITKAEVKEIKKAESGIVGEKRAEIKDVEIGNVEKNTITGIHGTTSSTGNLRKYKIGTRSEVKKGAATILTCIDGSKIEEFTIEITELENQNAKDIKGIKYKVTDKRLIEKTGGIIQGMSGSPIIQDGKLVGAVTHVIINNPETGYGIYIEWMLLDMGVIVE